MMIECIGCGAAGFILGGTIVGVAVHYRCTKKAMKKEDEKLAKIKSDLHLHDQEIDLLLDKVVNLDRDFTLYRRKA